LTKQEIREDRVMTVATQAADIVRKNARLVLAGTVVVVVAVVVAVLVAQGRIRSEKQAGAGMAQAQSLYFSGNFSQAATQFQGLAGRYGSAKSARLARLFEGNAQLAAGNAGAAEQAYRTFLRGLRLDPMLEAAGQRGLASSLASQQKFADAAAAYEKAAQINGNLMAGDDWFQAGRAFDQGGQKADAERDYRKVIEDYPQSQSVQEARIRLQEVLAR
jgi:TolA-binding protein